MGSDAVLWRVARGFAVYAIEYGASPSGSPMLKK